MSSTEPGSHRSRWVGAAAGLTLAVAFTTSLAFSAEPQAPRQVVREEPAHGSPTVEAAVVCGALAAYGWVAVKFYELGREFGKSLACQPRPIDRPDNGDDDDKRRQPSLPAYLLD